MAVLDDIHGYSKSTKDLFKTLLGEISKGEDFKDGISFLDMKNDALVSYMIEVCNIILNKVKGDSIEDSPSIERSVELRLTLEKIKTIDQKLNYQINKLINTTTSDAPTDHRVNLDNIEVDDDVTGEVDPSEADEEEQEDEEEDGEFSDDDSASNVVQNNKTVAAYKPPKLRSMPYEDVYEEKKVKKNRSNLNKVLMEDLQREMDDMPIEIEERTEKVDKERLQYEEDNFIRLQAPSKKRKKKANEAKKKKKYRVGRGGKRI